ncbi:hypothetical protein E1281_05230 [Actinomadura sp. KC345]|uniref:hypothetical protein n=1 Tax=Actinomadura sp. KC345 TaxID=2530371 RepID=UPI001050FF39|nr:hypothetical protein [Actinomadura sp. KC345]TDC57371.1 hypothetical protein E1281_05230 [Actinomadura sp. KC345]
MKGDKGPGGADGDRRPRNPYPLPGQNPDPREDDSPPDSSPPPASEMRPPPIPGMPPSKGAPPEAPPGFPAGGRSVRSGAMVWLMFLGPFVVAMLVIFSWAGHRIYGAGEDDGDGVAARPPDSPRPEPISTVPPKVKGWDAVTSAKYGMSYDVPSSWRILPSTVLIGWEAAHGQDRSMMSTAAVFREDVCKDGDDEYTRAHTGFNQYVEGGLTGVAEHAAKKWAANAYTSEGDPAPSIALKAPESVKAGRKKGVHVQADVVMKATGRCVPPTAVVHTVAVPGVGPGKTTVFILLADQGVPDAAPKAAIKKILGSLRPS